MNLPKKWYHGYNKEEWKWSKDCECYIHYATNSFLSPPESYCLGDRYIYAHFGYDSFGVVWRGSSSDNWGGQSFGYDLKAAIQWLHNTEYKHMGCELWSK